MLRGTHLRQSETPARPLEAPASPAPGHTPAGASLGRRGWLGAGGTSGWERRHPSGHLPGAVTAPGFSPDGPPHTSTPRDVQNPEPAPVTRLTPGAPGADRASGCVRPGGGAGQGRAGGSLAGCLAYSRCPAREGRARTVQAVCSAFLRGTHKQWGTRAGEGPVCGAAWTVCCCAFADGAALWVELGASNNLPVAMVEHQGHAPPAPSERPHCAAPKTWAPRGRPA